MLEVTHRYFVNFVAHTHWVQTRRRSSLNTKTIRINMALNGLVGSTSSGGGWQSVSTFDKDDVAVAGVVNTSLGESLVGYPRPGETLPPAPSTIQIQVVAPATLPEGYQFDALVNGRTIKVQVPVGGVEKGQTFSVGIAPESIAGSGSNTASGSISIPVGHWRDDIFDCFKYGICHPHCWTSFLCPLSKLKENVVGLVFVMLQASEFGAVIKQTTIDQVFFFISKHC